MPYLVEQLIRGRSAPISIGRDESVEKVLYLLRENDFSQLPVIDSGNNPLGMVTYESILRAVRNFKSNLDGLYVRDVMVNAPIFNLEDDLFDLLQQLKQTNVVLITDNSGVLVGIVTSYDSTEYFRSRAENLMYIEDIEAIIKEFIQLAFFSGDGSLDQVKLSDAVSKVTTTNNEIVQNKKQINFEDLSLGQYILMLVSKDTWPFFDKIFRKSRDSVRMILETVRDTRNSLAHFRTEITAEQTDQLRFCSDWLARCWEDNEHRIAHELFGRLVETYVTVPASTASVKEISSTDLSSSIYRVSQDHDIKHSEEIRLISEETLPEDSRYAPLAVWLQSQHGGINQVKISFDDIESIIGGTLPPSAYTYRAWWANDSQGHPHAQMWLDVGWRTTYLNFTEKQVTFTRIREREKAYIKFFGKLLAELRKKADFPIRSTSPDGTSWVVCQTISSPANIVAYFVFSFARAKRFRVELYIDTSNQDTTKQIFDIISAQITALEQILGQISWERIDDKRASRIAVYHPGVITSDEKSLNGLITWAVEKMKVFYKTIEPVAIQAIKEVMQP